MRNPLWIFPALVLGGCAGVGGYLGGGSSGGVYGGVGLAVQAAPTVESAVLRAVLLTRDLQIAPGRARAFFQDGVQTPGKDRYRPHCEFEISTVAEAPQTVHPGRFTVTGVVHRMVTDENAGIPLFVPSMFGGQDIFYETRIRLASRAQPGVRELICRDWSQDFGRGYYLGRGAIQAVLGNTLQLQ